jgi:glycosyltransferase involved in cell wall biosynthesis
MALAGYCAIRHQISISEKRRALTGRDLVAKKETVVADNKSADVRALKSVGIIVPVFNEADAIEPFYQALRPVVDGLPCKAEILFIDDGSSDATRSVIRRLKKDDERIHLVGLSRNFGKEAALSAGLDRIETDVAIPIDVDLQDPPDLIPALIERGREGFVVVHAVRNDRTADTLSKRLTAAAYYRVHNAISHDPLPPGVGDFRLIDRKVVHALRQLPERNRFMKGLFAWVGFRSVGVPYVRAARHTGATKLPWRRLWRLALDGITGFSTLPLRIWTYAGLVIAFLSFIYGLVVIIRTLIAGVDVPGYASLIVAVLFLGGIQLISLGVIGEYLGRLFVEAKQRPIYLVDEEE